jgi:hypothetical protein
MGEDKIAEQIEDLPWLTSTDHPYTQYPCERCHITIHREEFQIINICIHATTVAQFLEIHFKTLPPDRKVLIGGRLEYHARCSGQGKSHWERTVLAQHSSRWQVLTKTDVWWREHPRGEQSTYSGGGWLPKMSIIPDIHLWTVATHGYLSWYIPTCCRQCVSDSKYPNTGEITPRAILEI